MFFTFGWMGWFICVLIVAYLAACLKEWVAPAHPPGPFQLPLIGNIVPLFHHDTLTLNMEDHQKYGAVFPWRFLQYRGVSVCDAECVEYILKTNFKNYEKGPLLQSVLRPLLGHGIFAVNGDIWKQQRLAAKPLFRLDSLRDMIPIFYKKGTVVIRILQQTLDSQQPIDLQNIYMRYTLDSIGEIGFGVDINSLNYPTPFSQWFDYAQLELNKRADFPQRKYFVFREFNATIANIDQYVYKIINERKNDDIASLEMKKDLLSRYMCMRDEKGKPFTDKYLRDIITTFMIAGRDTTGILLTWSSYLISQHPQVELKVLEEFQQITGSYCKDEDLTADILDKLVYLKAVLNETLRLYPPVPGELKWAVNDDILPNGYPIKAGTEVVFHPYSIHRQKRYWGEDAEEFIPERWFKDRNSSGPFIKVPPFQFFPFLGGPRICLGMKMALLETKLLLSMILPKFSFSLVPGHEMKPQNAITLPAKYGLRVMIHPRTAPTPQPLHSN